MYQLFASRSIMSRPLLKLLRSRKLFVAHLIQRVLLDLPRLQRVVSTSDAKLLLLNPNKISQDINLWTQGTRKFFEESKAELVQHTINLGYDYWSMGDIYDSVLPEGLPRNYSFGVVGHIAHLNLRDEALKYKKLIGEVILSKVKSIKTVVNKLDTITAKFRVFDMEVLAGEKLLVTTIREGNCTFKLDFEKVYWNPKLQGEHERLVKKYFKKGDIICDAFAGIGPFALPAAKKGCIVFANDLNLESFKYLQENIKINKLTSFVRPFCIDGGEFIRNSISILHEELGPESTTKSGNKRKFEETKHIPKNLLFSHYIMNLPQSALEFVHEYIGLYKGHTADENKQVLGIPLVHCYVFCRTQTRDQGLLRGIFIPLLEEKLKSRISPDQVIEIHNVRSVAPNKDMYCITFKLSPEILYRQ